MRELKRASLNFQRKRSLVSRGQANPRYTICPFPLVEVFPRVDLKSAACTEATHGVTQAPHWCSGFK